LHILLDNGGPALTANTPALGRGAKDKCAISPQAKISGCDVDSNVFFTMIKPSSVVSKSAV